MNRIVQPAIALGVLLMLSSVAGAAVRYAKSDGLAVGPCQTWLTACTLNQALTQAVAGDEVWVKAGTYGPITLKNGVKTIGGFAGAETSVAQSNPASNVTVVDGDEQRAVYGANQGGSTMLRGFKIVNGFDADDQGGGGLKLVDSSALIVQCIFENNTASIMGGAVMVSGLGSPQFINCIFRNNGSTPSNVRPYEGGAVFLDGASATFTNCLFHGNKAGGGGGVAVVPGSAAVFNNCTMTSNQATMTRGGAVRDPSGAASFRNCILWGNTRIEAGVPLADQIYSPGLDAKVTYSDAEGAWPGTGNINADPQFTASYALQTTSPCKNAGDSTPGANTLPADAGDLDWDTNTVEPIPKDLAQLPRIRLGTVDMRAYELFTDTPPPPPPGGGDN